jgi:hypothetical protein
MTAIEELLAVERAIPKEVAAGILSGEYSLHGGVIRDEGGRIVRHLISASPDSLNPFGAVQGTAALLSTHQLQNLQAVMQNLFALSTATMVMSGLNLAITLVAFAALRSSLKQVDDRLKEIGKDVKWIKSFLDVSRRGKLLHAIEELSSLPTEDSNRREILHQSRTTLGEVKMQYLQHWDESADPMEKLAYQNFYCTAFLAHARCSAELDMQEKSVDEFERSLREWHDRARKFIRDDIFNDDRARFIGKRYVESAPVGKIVGWMDFVFDEAKGYQWLDTLRQEFKPSARLSLHSKKEQQREAEAIRKVDNLVSKNNVLQGHLSQMRFLKEQSIRPSQFEAFLRKASESTDAQSFLLALRSDGLPRLQQTATAS